MDPSSSKPTDEGPEWGQRRRGGASSPRADWEQVRDEFEQATRAWEAHQAASEPGRGEERSWTPPGAAPRPTPGADLSALFVLLDTLRRAAPAELQERTTSLIR